MTPPRLLAMLFVLALAACDGTPASPDESSANDLTAALSHVPAGPTMIGFESFAEGADVSNPHPFLNIASLDGHNIVAIWDEQSGNHTGLTAYVAFDPVGGPSSRTNGCLTDGAGFALLPPGVERHRLRFTFPGEATVSEFSLRALDFGDRIGSGEGRDHSIAMRAYSGSVEVAADVRSGTYSGEAQGDACDPVGSTLFGILDLSVSAAGIDRVDVFMEDGGDRATGYDNVSFTLEPHDPTNKDDCKNGGWADFGFRNQGQCIRFVNTGKDSRGGTDLTPESWTAGP